jgi:hypothetical protein
VTEPAKIPGGGGTIGAGVVFGALFIGLKLTGYITWSWCWVTAPLWAPYALIAVLLAVWFVLTLILEVLK